MEVIRISYPVDGKVKDRVVDVTECSGVLLLDSLVVLQRKSGRAIEIPCADHATAQTKYNAILAALTTLVTV